MRTPIRYPPNFGNPPPPHFSSHTACELLVHDVLCVHNVHKQPVSHTGLVSGPSSVRNAVVVVLDVLRQTAARSHFGELFGLPLSSLFGESHASDLVWRVAQLIL